MIPAESRIRFVPSDPFGGGNLRSIWPALALAEKGWGATYKMWIPKPTAFQEYHLVHIHRPLFPGFEIHVKRWHEFGWKVIVDEDDDLSRINQTKNEIGLQEWVPEAVKAHDKAMRMADGVTVSSDALKEVYGKLNPNIHVTHNYLPRQYQFVKLPITDGIPRVHWAGIVMTHRHDLEWIAPVADRMCRGAIFKTVGGPNTARVLRLEDTQTEEEGFMSDPHDLYAYMSRATVGIVPLLPCEFNDAKSWLKALEYMTVGVPVVATNCREQRKLIDHGVNGYLADTPEEFADYVQELVHDPDLRATMAEAAKKKAGTMAIEDHVGEWESALGSVLELAEVGRGGA